MPSLFDRTMELTPLGDGRYAATVTADWNGPVAPNGGVLAAMMLRAAQAELGAPAPPPRTVAAHFLEAPTAGPVTLAVEVLRRGKRVAVCDVRLRQGDVLACQAEIVCSAARPGAAQLTRRPPQMAPVDQVAPFDPVRIPSAPPVFGQLEVRAVRGDRLFTGAGEAHTGGWVSLRDDPAPLDAARLCALADLWWPAVFGLLERPAAVPTIQLTVYLRRTEPAPRAPLFACFRTTEIAEGHLEEDGELWSADGELLVESRQLALLPAVRDASGQ